MIIHYYGSRKELFNKNSKSKNLIVLREVYSLSSTSSLIEIKPPNKNLIIFRYLANRSVFPDEGIRSIKLSYYKKEQL